MDKIFHLAQIPIRNPLIQGNFVSDTLLTIIVNSDPFYVLQPQIFMLPRQQLRTMRSPIAPLVSGLQEQVPAPATAKNNRSNRIIVRN